MNMSSLVPFVQRTKSDVIPSICSLYFGIYIMPHECRRGSYEYSYNLLSTCFGCFTTGSIVTGMAVVRKLCRLHKK